MQCQAVQRIHRSPGLEGEKHVEILVEIGDKIRTKIIDLEYRLVPHKIRHPGDLFTVYHRGFICCADRWSVVPILIRQPDTQGLSPGDHLAFPG